MGILVKKYITRKKLSVILDAETACWGNPAFDLAFLNNHIILKVYSTKKFLIVT